MVTNFSTFEFHQMLKEDHSSHRKVQANEAWKMPDMLLTSAFPWPTCTCMLAHLTLKICIVCLEA
ncbi:hypothetical protein X975_21711, partial [Stegodyphus mimosarum]